MASDTEKIKMIASIPPIISSIMTNLTAKELNVCSQVCQLWHNIAATEKKRRTKICWFSFEFCRIEGAHRAPCRSQTLDKSCLEPFRNYMNELPIEPKTTLIFCTKAMARNPEPHFKPPIRRLKRKYGSDVDKSALDRSSLRYPVIGSLLPLFPRECDIGFCTARGIIGTTSDNKSTREIEMCPSLSAIFFPEIRGLEIYRFIMSGFGFDITDEMPYDQVTGIPADKPIKCLLIFLYDRVGSFKTLPFNKIIRHYVEKQNWEIALGGAYVNHMFFPRHKSRRRNQSYGIAFTGDNVKAASVLIKPDMDTREQITERLKCFADADLLEGQCLAFMFTCVGRGYYFFDECNVESSIFRAMFPSVPLFGVFGEGEIGINYIPGKPCKIGQLYSWFRNYTTVFVLISIKG